MQRAVHTRAQLQRLLRVVRKRGALNRRDGEHRREETLSVGIELRDLQLDRLIGHGQRDMVVANRPACRRRRTHGDNVAAAFDAERERVDRDVARSGGGLGQGVAHARLEQAVDRQLAVRIRRELMGILAVRAHTRQGEDRILELDVAVGVGLGQADADERVGHRKGEGVIRLAVAIRVCPGVAKCRRSRCDRQIVVKCQRAVALDGEGQLVVERIVTRGRLGLVDDVGATHHELARHLDFAVGLAIGGIGDDLGGIGVIREGGFTNWRDGELRIHKRLAREVLLIDDQVGLGVLHHDARTHAWRFARDREFAAFQRTAAVFRQIAGGCVRFHELIGIPREPRHLELAARKIARIGRCRLGTVCIPRQCIAVRCFKALDDRRPAAIVLLHLQAKGRVDVLVGTALAQGHLARQAIVLDAVRAGAIRIECALRHGEAHRIAPGLGHEVDRLIMVLVAHGEGCREGRSHVVAGVSRLHQLIRALVVHRDGQQALLIRGNPRLNGRLIIKSAIGIRIAIEREHGPFDWIAQCRVVLLDGQRTRERRIAQTCICHDRSPQRFHHGRLRLW